MKTNNVLAWLLVAESGNLALGTRIVKDLNAPCCFGELEQSTQENPFFFSLVSNSVALEADKRTSTPRLRPRKGQVPWWHDRSKASKFRFRRDSMKRSRLRVYFGPEESSATAVHSADVRRQAVTVSAKEVFDLLADAIRDERQWLEDFYDDEISIPADLYEVLLAYEHYRRPSA